MNLYYNRWIGAGQAGPTTEQQIDHFVELARDHRVESIGVRACAGVPPHDGVETARGSWLPARIPRGETLA